MLQLTNFSLVSDEGWQRILMPLYYNPKESDMATNLQGYAHHLLSDGCFANISQITKAIKDNDSGEALLCLGQLREKIYALQDYTRDLETNASKVLGDSPNTKS
jgi:hypothetical protein